jgi:hypothetical protein
MKRTTSVTDTAVLALSRSACLGNDIAADGDVGEGPQLAIGILHWHAARVIQRPTETGGSPAS